MASDCLILFGVFVSFLIYLQKNYVVMIWRLAMSFLKLKTLLNMVTGPTFVKNVTDCPMFTMIAMFLGMWNCCRYLNPIIIVGQVYIHRVLFYTISIISEKGKKYKRGKWTKPSSVLSMVDHFKL